MNPTRITNKKKKNKSDKDWKHKQNPTGIGNAKWDPTRIDNV